MVIKEFSKIPNSMLEALALVNLSPYESRVFWAVFRATHGWQRTRVKLNASRMARDIGIDRMSFKRAMHSLAGRRVLIVTRHEQKGVFVAVETDASRWLDKAPKQVAFDFELIAAGGGKT